MTQDFSPITPPPELVKEWASAFYGATIAPGEAAIDIATQAARWGADQELEACYQWVTHELNMPGSAICLREDRRPEPPSLKEQALGLLNEGPVSDLLDDEVAVIRRALESLPD